MALYFHLHNVSCLPLFAYIAHIKAICNEANERRKPLQYNTQQPNYERYTPPPLYRCNRKHPSSLSFFLFFLIFSLFLIVRIFYLNQDAQAVI